MLLNFKKTIGLIIAALFINNHCQATVISCPSKLPLNLEKQTKWSQWNINNPNQSKQKTGPKNTFISSDILEGAPGDEKKPSPALLAPDQETKEHDQIIQTWHFKDSKKHFLLICRYKNSDIYLSTALPATISHCKQKLALTNPKSSVPSGVTVKSIDCF